MLDSFWLFVLADEPDGFKVHGLHAGTTEHTIRHRNKIQLLVASALQRLQHKGFLLYKERSVGRTRGFDS